MLDVDMNVGKDILTTLTDITDTRENAGMNTRIIIKIILADRHIFIFLFCNYIDNIYILPYSFLLEEF